jgi:WD40 repeat protein
MKNGTIQLLNSKTKKEVSKNADFKHQNADMIPCFSPDGKQFITSDQSGFLRLWDAETGKQKGPAMKYRSYPLAEMEFSPDGKKILTRYLNNKPEFNGYAEDEKNTAVIWDAETGKQIRDEIPLSYDQRLKSGYEGKLVAIERYDADGLFNRPAQMEQLITIETGDLDIPTHLLKLQALMVSGYKFDFETNEKIVLSPQEFRDIKKQYDSLARDHFKTCEYYSYNFWKRNNETEAKKIRLINVWGKKTFTADQFTIIPELQLGDTTQKENNGRFLAPNQAIVSKNGIYMLAYQRDGDLVIYKKEKMEPIWSTQTFGMPAYKTIMQYDGNLVIYYQDPGIERGSYVAWSSDTWENNAGARLVLEDDGKLVIYNTRNEPVWDNINGKRTEELKK